jgi:hypothetical protein
MHDDEQVLLRAGIERFARTISQQPLGLAKFAPESWVENARQQGRAERRRATLWLDVSAQAGAGNSWSRLPHCHPSRRLASA